MAKPADLDDARALCFNQRAGKLVEKFPTCYWGLQCVGPLYKAAQNDVFWSIREVKCKHFFNLFEQSSLSKEFWKHLKSAVGQIIKSEVSHIRVDTDDIINKPYAMANALRILYFCGRYLIWLSLYNGRTVKKEGSFDMIQGPITVWFLQAEFKVISPSKKLKMCSKRRIHNLDVFLFPKILKSFCVQNEKYFERDCCSLYVLSIIIMKIIIFRFWAFCL